MTRSLLNVFQVGVTAACLVAAMPALASPKKTSTSTTAPSTTAAAPATTAATTTPAASAAPGSAVFPTAISSKYASQKAGEARMHTCLDQYHANKATNANGGMKWIQSGGGYYSACSKKLKAG